MTYEEIMLVREALKFSRPVMSQYPEPVKRHEKALQIVTAELIRLKRENFEILNSHNKAMESSDDE